MNPRPRRARSIIAAITLGVLTVACSSDGETTEVTEQYVTTEGDEVSISLARSPIPADGETSTAVYGILANNTELPLRVIAVSSPMAETVEFQQPSASGELERITSGFLIDVEGGVIMEAGGFQLTMTDVDTAAWDDLIEVTFQLDSGNTFTFQAAPFEG